MAVAEQDLRPMWSQGAAIAAECDRTPIQNVRFRCVVLDQRGLQLVTDVHPNLTVVVVPPGQVERTSHLVSAALAGADCGVHVELTDGQGRNLLLFRPYGGRSRVLDLDRQVEALPPTLQAARESPAAMGFPPSPSGPSSRAVRAADVVVRLSAVEQHTLWAAAERLSEILGPGAVGRGETDEHHGAAEVSSPRPVARRRRSGFGRRVRAGGDAVTDASRDAARGAWRSVAGEVPLEAALSLRSAIEACANARSRTVALAAVSPGPQSPPSELSMQSDLPGDLQPVRDAAEALAAVLDAPACVPQTLVLPPPGAAGAAVQLLLDMLPDLLAGRQVIAVTSDSDVADWGRLEELAGRAATAQARCR